MNEGTIASGANHPRLTSRLLVIQALVLAASVVVAVGWVSFSSPTGQSLRIQEAHLIAVSLASNPDLSANETGAETARLLLETARTSTGVASIGIINTHGIVLDAVGTVTKGSVVPEALPKRQWSGMIASPLGVLPASIVPVTTSGHSESILVEIHRQSALNGIVNILVRALEAILVALGIGALGSWLMARWLRGHTFGLELDELTNLIQEQEAIFHGIRDAVVGIDANNRFQFANEEGRRLLRLPSRFLQRPVKVLVPECRLQDILLGKTIGRDLMVVHEDRILLVNRRSVKVADRLLGYVVTLNDRTESEALVRELDGMLGLTDALRAQAHDFSNRMHTVVGLIELGETEDAVRFATNIALRDTALMDRLTAEIKNPVVVALLLAKSAIAAERNVDLRLGASVAIPADIPSPSDIVTLLGNLVDNAIDAVQSVQPAWVEVRLSRQETTLVIQVSDSGPGIPGEHAEEIFLDGYTTKVAANGSRRGLGLALVKQLVTRHGGAISISREVGALFTVELPDLFCGLDPPSATKTAPITGSPT
ncbi:MAG: sensor histidine kinase [Ferrimicrobium sp.]